MPFKAADIRSQGCVASEKEWWFHDRSDVPEQTESGRVTMNEMSGLCMLWLGCRHVSTPLGVDTIIYI